MKPPSPGTELNGVVRMSHPAHMGLGAESQTPSVSFSGSMKRRRLKKKSAVSSPCLRVKTAEEEGVGTRSPVVLFVLLVLWSNLDSG